MAADHDIYEDMGQTPLVDADLAGDIARKAGWYAKNMRTFWKPLARKAIVNPARKVYEHYREDPWFRASTSLKMSSIINMFFIIYQGYNAFMRSSYWYGALAVYYAMLTFLRVTMVTFMQTDAADGREELRRYRFCGYMLLLLTTIIIAMGIIINRIGHRPVYPGHMVFVTAAFTVYNVTFAIFNYVKWRQLEDPVVSASKALSIASALMSIYTLQNAVIGRYAAFSDATMVHVFTYLTPALVLIAITGMSLFIILRVNWVLKHIGND